VPAVYSHARAAQTYTVSSWKSSSTCAATTMPSVHGSPFLLLHTTFSKVCAITRTNNHHEYTVEKNACMQIHQIVIRSRVDPVSEAHIDHDADDHVGQSHQNIGNANIPALCTHGYVSAGVRGKAACA
jgi:hypothetical protein